MMFSLFSFKNDKCSGSPLAIKADNKDEIIIDYTYTVRYQVSYGSILKDFLKKSLYIFI